MIVRPMNAVLGPKDALKKRGFIFEPKLDGYRALCYKNKNITFISRTGKNLTKEFPELDFFNNIRAKRAIIDGEIVAYNNKGLPDFQALQNRKREKIHASFIAFDILMKNTKLLMQKPLIERKKILQDTVRETDNLQVIVFTYNGKKLWREVLKRNLEGVMAKKADSLYVQRRDSAWIKIKKQKTIDAIILGYTTLKHELSSLLLGLYFNNEIIYIGKVGTGFSESTKKTLRQKFHGLVIKKVIKKITLLKPVLVCEVAYASLTKDKKLRSASFMRLREDKPARECTFDQLKSKKFL